MYLITGARKIISLHGDRKQTFSDRDSRITSLDAKSYRRISVLLLTTFAGYLGAIRRTAGARARIDFPCQVRGRDGEDRCPSSDQI